MSKISSKYEFKSPGFTLIELLVVIALIGLLAGLANSIFKSAIESSKSATEKLAIKQIIQGWNSYSLENDNEVMSGYGGQRSGEILLDSNGSYEKKSNGEWRYDCTETFSYAISPEGDKLSCTGAECWPYAWRLSQFLDDAWKTLFSGQDQLEIQTLGENLEWYGLGLRTSFGINSEWIGGDIDSTNREIFCQYREISKQQGYRLEGRFVKRLSQIKKPSVILLFASSMKKSFDQQLGDEVKITEQDFSTYTRGSCRVLSDQGYVQQAPREPWKANPEYSEDIGFLSLRNGGLALYGSPDGSIKTKSYEALKDMSYWRN